VVALGAFAQTEDLQGLKIREIHPKPTPSPFPLDGRGIARGALEFRAPGQMTAADRDLVSANEGEIARRAELQGFRLDSDAAGWGYEQAVCPVFPDHVILEYSRDSGKGDLTLFAAVVPRGEGHVRVIPVRRRGYSLFTPSSANSLTLNDFNHLVKESPNGLDPDWLTLGLCYGALAGGHVRAALHPSSAAEEEYPLLAPAMLSVSREGGAVVRLGDETPPPHGMDWKLTFAQSGRLLQVKHQAAQVLTVRPVAGSAQEVPGKPVAGAALDVGGPGK